MHCQMARPALRQVGAVRPGRDRAGLRGRVFQWGDCRVSPDQPADRHQVTVPICRPASSGAVRRAADWPAAASRRRAGDGGPGHQAESPSEETSVLERAQPEGALAAAGLFHRSVVAVENETRSYLRIHSELCKPFRWTKSADEIIESMHSAI